MKYKTPKEVMDFLHKSIKKILKVDIRQRTRKREVIDARRIFLAILKEYYPSLGEASFMGGNYRRSSGKKEISLTFVGNYLGVKHGSIISCSRSTPQLMRDKKFSDKYKKVAIVCSTSIPPRLEYLEFEIKAAEKHLKNLYTQKEKLKELEDGRSKIQQTEILFEEGV